MSSSKCTFVTTTVSAVLFTCLISNRKYKFAVTWLLIGGCLNQLSKKESRIHAIGSNILSGSFISILGLCASSALCHSGEEILPDLLFNVLTRIASRGLFNAPVLMCAKKT